MLCYAMLCYAMLCYAILYYTILNYTIQYYTIDTVLQDFHSWTPPICHWKSGDLEDVVLYFTMLCYAMPCHAMLCYAMLCYAMLCYAILNYTIDTVLEDFYSWTPPICYWKSGDLKDFVLYFTMI